MKKLKLRIETLAVDSFQTGREQAKPGTVRGHGDDCTWFASCLCDTAYYYCGTGRDTIYSYTYTEDERCVLNDSAECVVISRVRICEASDNC